MKKIISTLFIALAASLSQVYAQKTIFSEDFGGVGCPAPPYYSSTAIPCDKDSINYTSSFIFADGTKASTPGHYMLTKRTTTTMSPGAWWGSTSTNYVSDHTGNGSYMMVVDAAATTDIPFFVYIINGLCANTQLTLSFWVGNLVRGGNNGGITSNNYVNPTLQVEIDDGSASPPKSSPWPIAKASSAATVWTQETFSFTAMSSSDTLRFFDSEAGTTGNDFVLDDIKIDLDLPNIIVNGLNNPYCAGTYLDLTASFDDPDKANTDFGKDPVVHWYFWDASNGVPQKPTNLGDWNTYMSQWTELPDSGLVYHGTVKAGYYMVVAGGSKYNFTGDYMCCSVSDPFEVTTTTTDARLLYWKRNASEGLVSQDWNDPQNWLERNTTDGTFSQALEAPTKCTDVHIPGDADFYPSLDITATAPTCSCRDIWFHFGGMIGRPDLLDYHYAYVQYNYGISNGTDNGIDEDLDNSGVSFSATPMSFNRWYALSAPLKSMASGDFGLRGFPRIWHQNFMTVTQPNSKGTITGEWYSPETNNSWDLGNQYNAIAVWVDGDLTNPLVTSPHSYQENLNGLKGILEMPYFDNTNIIAYRGGFYHTDGVSYFPYYYADQTNFPLSGTYDNMPRGEESYRFIFDQNLTNGVYTMAVPAGQDVMVGNPFMSNLDFDEFINDNPDVVPTYRLYSGNNFMSYSYTAGSPDMSMRYIAPLQAFVVNSPSGVLNFNVKNAVAHKDDPTGGQTASTFRSSIINTGVKADVLFLKAESQAGVSWLTLSMQNVNEKNLILLLPDGYPDVPQLYATDETGQKNSIQFEGGYVTSIPIGILSSDSTSQVTLTLYNQDKLNVDSLELWDKYLNKTVDLTTNNSYTFQNAPSVQDRFVLLLGENKTVTGMPSVDATHSVNVSASNNMLYVNATSGIEDVSVITLQGITVVKDNAIGQTTYTKSLSLPSGLYLVSVKLKTGETSVAKVRI